MLLSSMVMQMFIGKHYNYKSVERKTSLFRFSFCKHVIQTYNHYISSMIINDYILYLNSGQKYKIFLSLGINPFFTIFFYIQINC